MQHPVFLTLRIKGEHVPLQLMDETQAYGDTFSAELRAVSTPPLPQGSPQIFVPKTL